MSSKSKYPWYKERLKTKYSKDINPVHYYKNWTFLKDGQDDFRDGFPSTDDQVVIKPRRGPSPAFLLDDKSSTSSGSTNSRASRGHHAKKLSAEERLYSSKIPATDRKWKRVLQLEANLLAHPLALFPDLEQGLNPELYEEIVDILDPDLLDIMGSEDDVSSRSDQSELTGDLSTSELGGNKSPEVSQKSGVDFMKLLRKKRASGLEHKTAELEEHEEKIKKIARDFCEWSNSLGEGGPNLEEETIEALFASGYSQAKQTTGPVHVVELNSIPPELRQRAGLAAVEDETERLDEAHGPLKKDHAHRFGAWYLAPDSWKRMERNAPLIDPDEELKRDNTDSKIRQRELHQKLLNLHGTKAFRGYLEKRGRPKPEFMNDIIELQDATNKP